MASSNASSNSSSIGHKEETIPEGWRKCYSNTHKSYYYFNSKNGTSSWTVPTSSTITEAAPVLTSSGSLQPVTIKANEKVDIKKDGDDCQSKAKDHDVILAPSLEAISKVAVIVPFRDLHVEQNRKKHLNKFVPAMISFLKQSSVPFHIFIIEQSDDNRKFNRGKLLNIGYDIAIKAHFNIVIFHDVDLIPTFPALLHTYTCPFTSSGNQPIHIAKLWKGRYSSNDNYFGGIVKFSAEQFRTVNGFPNNFWGWGGEDDELFKRVTAVGMKPIAPALPADEGSTTAIMDLEAMDLTQKLAFLREHRTWKCMNKVELLQEHTTTWMTNGLRDLTYEILSERNLFAEDGSQYRHASVVTVDVKVNDHWTDLKCGLLDTQLDEPVRAVKDRFGAAKSNNSYSNTNTNSNKRKL